MRRRFALVLVAAAALLGVGATAAQAATHIYSPVPTGLARVCVGAEAAGTVLCIHL